MARYIDANKIDYTVTTVGADEFAGLRAVAFESDIDLIPTADVVPTERLENALALLDKTEDELYGPEGEVTKLTAELNSYKMHYQNLAKEIFEGIDELIFQHGRGDLADKYFYLAVDELKKKYTEGAANGGKQE